MSFVYPVPSWRGRMPVISSSYMSEDRPTHRGVDIMYRRLASDGGTPGKYDLPSYAPLHFMPPGIPALSIGPGIVRTAKNTSTGDYVAIDHSDGWRSEYMHLRNLRVARGQRVAAGSVIGDISYNPSDFRLIHLHFQLRKNGSAVDPRPVISDFPVLALRETAAGGPRGRRVLLLVGIAAALAGGAYYIARNPPQWAPWA